MDQYDLHKPNGDQGEGYDDWYRLIGADPTPEEMPDAPQNGEPQNGVPENGVPQSGAAGEKEDEDRGPIPFGEDGAAFLRNVLQHGVFLGIGMLVLMILQYARQR
jgi:hypothetical protein